MEKKKAAPHSEVDHQKKKVEEKALETVEAELEKIRTELEAAKTEAEGYLDGWKRAQADFINYKRRAEQEKEDTIKYANTSFILNILPILDDFERAKANLNSEDGASFMDGIKLVERKLKSFLEGQGVSEIKALGEPFDPNVHEAVLRAEGEEGMVVQEFEKGYKLHDRVIRASKVAVGTGETAK